MTRKFWLPAWLTCAIFASNVWAQSSTEVRTIGRYSWPEATVMSHQVSSNASGLIAVVLRPVVAPSAVVSAELSDQPVHGHLIEVQVAHTQVYLDPRVDYLRQHPDSRMPNNYITAALHRHHSLTKSGARIVVGLQSPRVRQRYLREALMRERGLGGSQPAEERSPMPSMPEAPREDQTPSRARIVASAQ